MDIRVLTAVLWAVFWGLIAGGFLFERYLQYLMKPPTDARTAVRTYEKHIRGVKFSWQDDVPPSPWETFTWEEKMGWVRRRSVLNWSTAAFGVGLLISYVWYALYEVELMAQVRAGEVGQAALLLINRPEVIAQILVLFASLAVIIWARRNPL